MGLGIRVLRCRIPRCVFDGDGDGDGDGVRDAVGME